MDKPEGWARLCHLPVYFHVGYAEIENVNR